MRFKRKPVLTDEQNRELTAFVKKFQPRIFGRLAMTRRLAWCMMDIIRTGNGQALDRPHATPSDVRFLAQAEGAGRRELSIIERSLRTAIDEQVSAGKIVVDRVTVPRRFFFGLIKIYEYRFEKPSSI